MTSKDEKKKILIVDDIAENVDVLNNILLPHYRRAVALNGKKALQIAQSNKPPDLILLDIMMPGMDGYEVCKRLKEDPKTADIPIIFVTAKSDEADETKGFEVGAVDYITKPIKPAVVLSRVRTHLRLQDALQELIEKNAQLEEYNRLRDEVERITRHDLKSPLNVVIGAPRMILDRGGLNESQEKLMVMVEQSGLRMLDMLNRSLDMFKMETGRYNLDPQPVDLLDVLRNLLAEIERSGTSPGVKLEVRVHDEPVKEGVSFGVMGEGLLFYTLFSNILKNAVEASQSGDLVSVGLERNGDGVLVSVHNPAKVPDEVEDRFFEKYATAGKKRGTGLGTYSALLITRTLGGEIDMTTSHEEGTLVRIRLPNQPPRPQTSSQAAGQPAQSA